MNSSVGTLVSLFIPLRVTPRTQCTGVLGSLMGCWGKISPKPFSMNKREWLKAWSSVLIDMEMKSCLMPFICSCSLPNENFVSCREVTSVNGIEIDAATHRFSYLIVPFNRRKTHRRRKRRHTLIVFVVFQIPHMVS